MPKFNHPLRLSLIVSSMLLLLNAWATTNGMQPGIYALP
jgi:hypothetical protein